MHISLDSALGRQRRLNSVGENVLQIAPDAAAAYSLRSLTGGDPKVVRVRRASDNGERDFTSSDVTSGEMLRWVNTQAIKPLDIQALEADGRTGDFLIAKAAYSLRSLGTRQATLAATGDTVARANDKFVAQVRRNVNGDLKSFTATEVTDGTLTSFVNESFTSSLPLDVSGSASAAYSLRKLKTGGTSVTSSGDTGGDTTGDYVVQVRRGSDDTLKSFKASEVTDGTLTDFVNVSKDYVGSARFQNSANSNVSLSSSFTLEATNSWSIKFGYIGGDALTGLFGSSSVVNTGFWFGSPNYFGLTDDANNYQQNNLDSELAIKLGQHYEIEFFNTPSEGVRARVNGVTTTATPNIYGNITLNRIGESRGRLGSRVIENVRIDLNGDGNLDYSYAGDGNQASNWTDRAGSNNGTPQSNVLTYNNEFTDGHVKTWYDQSGNSRDAVQGTAASQPKIVDAGTLVERTINGTSSPSVQFTASNSMTHGLTSLSADGQQSLFFVADNQVTSNTSHRLIEIMSNTSDEADRRRPLIFQDSSSSLKFSVDNLGGFTRTTSQSNFVSLYSSITEDSGGGTHTAHQDGSQFGSESVTLNTNATIALSDRGLGEVVSGTAGAFFFTEILYYPSDQSDKRRAIEESISGHYGITLGSFNRDGFVKTWYDQSVTNEAGDTATGNHAVQATAASQPKIVNAGSLLNELDFDGTDDTLAIDFGADLSQANSLFMVHQSDTTTDTKNKFFDRAGSDSPLTALNQAGSNYRMQSSSTSLDTTVALTTNKSLIFALYNGASSLFAKNGTATSALNAGSGSINQNSSLGSSGSNFYNGTMQEFIVYNSDQTDNRTAIEANIGEAYSITGIPAYDDEVDGFVETWYDQSGNSRDATQATAGNQPKIVSAGSLVTNGIQFTAGSSTELSMPSSIISNINSAAAFLVSKPAGFLEGALQISSGDGTLFRVGNNVFGSLRNQYGSVSALLASNDSAKHLFSLVTGDTNAESFLDGTSKNTTLLASGYSASGFIGSLGGTNFFAGTIEEVIIYDNNQTANRLALETNINSHYSIF